MDLLSYLDNIKLLINGKFKYFSYNSNCNSLEILDGHFLSGIDIDCSITPDNVCILKINELELKYDEVNGKVTTRKGSIGSNVILEPCDNISFYLKHSDRYFDEELNLVEKEKAIKVQALWTYEADKLNYQHAIPFSANKDSEISDSLISIEGLPISLNKDSFQIILNGHSYDYASEFEGQFFFSGETYRDGDKFNLARINDKLTLHNPSKGYLGRGMNEYGSECIMYYKEIPDNLAYLEKCEDNGMYLTRCGGGESGEDSKDGSNEDDYLYIFWAKSSCGFSDFTRKREEASVFQFILYYEVNKEEESTD
jgi:hypothetical protein